MELRRWPAVLATAVLMAFPAPATAGAAERDMSKPVPPTASHDPTVYAGDSTDHSQAPADDGNSTDEGGNPDDGANTAGEGGNSADDGEEPDDSGTDGENAGEGTTCTSVYNTAPAFGPLIVCVDPGPGGGLPGLRGVPAG